MRKCKTEGCENKGAPIVMNDGMIFLCDKCRLQLFTALLRNNVPKGTKSKFRI